MVSRGSTIPLGHQAYRPLRDMLRDSVLLVALCLLGSAPGRGADYLTSPGRFVSHYVLGRRPPTRMRKLTARNFSWRKDGPIDAYFIQSVIPEFFNAVSTVLWLQSSIQRVAAENSNN